MPGTGTWRKPYHEITLDKLELVGETLLDSIPCGALNLVVVVVETGDVGIGELGNLPGRATDTAANIENLHASLDANLHGKVVFVAGDGLVERLANRVAAEVEALAPAILVQIRCKVVVTGATNGQIMSPTIAIETQGQLTALSMSHTPLSGPLCRRPSLSLRSCCRSA